MLGSLSGAEFERAAQEAARTAPPRENGGNQDIKNLSRGSRVFYPVFVPGAKLSVGDLHFSQGDGEITFCGEEVLVIPTDIRHNSRRSPGRGTTTSPGQPSESSRWQRSIPKPHASPTISR